MHGRVQRGKLLAEPHVRPDELDLGVPVHDRVRHVNVHDLTEVGLGVVLLVEEAGVEAAFTPERGRGAHTHTRMHARELARVSTGGP